MNRGEYMKTNTEKELNDVEKIKNATDALSETLQQLGGAAYQQPGSEGTEESSPTGDTSEGQPGKDDEDIVDGEFKQV